MIKRSDQLQLTADKREILDLPKLPSATSFIRDTLSEIVAESFKVVRKWQEKPN